VFPFASPTLPDRLTWPWLRAKEEAIGAGCEGEEVGERRASRRAQMGSWGWARIGRLGGVVRGKARGKAGGVRDGEVGDAGVVFSLL